MSLPVLVSCTTEEKGAPYLEALVSVGIPRAAVRVLASDRAHAAEVAGRAAEAAGLLLCGGPDIDPRYYRETAHPEANLTIVPARDTLEWELLAGAREGATPVFGVCRGLQILNAFLGGTLWQDLKLMWPGSLLHDLSFPRDALIHTLQVTDPEGELGALLAADASLVNSRHHQAVKVLAPELHAVASAPDGIVEAAVGTVPGWWVWAVQWHPENLMMLAAQRALWERFAREVAARTGAAREPVAR